MNTVGTDQDVAMRGPDVTSGAIEKIGGDAAFVLGESAEPAAGVNGVMPQPLLNGAVDHALQPATMN